MALHVAANGLDVLASSPVQPCRCGQPAHVHYVCAVCRNVYALRTPAYLLRHLNVHLVGRKVLGSRGRDASPVQAPPAPAPNAVEIPPAPLPPRLFRLQLTLYPSLSLCPKRNQFGPHLSCRLCQQVMQVIPLQSMSESKPILPVPPTLPNIDASYSASVYVNDCACTSSSAQPPKLFRLSLCPKANRLCVRLVLPNSSSAQPLK